MPSSSETGAYLDLGGQRLHYVDEGSGEPVVMVHGNPTWSFYYRGLRQGLRGEYRVVVPDHVGCGLSDKPPASAYPYTLARRVDDLGRLLDALALDDVTLVLHDWGGMIGLAWALRHPGRVRRLVLLNTAGFLKPAAKRLPWSIRVCRTPLLGAVLVRGLNLFLRGALRACTVRPLPAEARAGYLAPYDSWRNRIAIHRFVEDIPLDPSHPSYALVREVDEGLARLAGLPTLICWGEQDFVFDRHFLAEWQRRFPAAEVHRYPRAGHLVLEDAGPEVLEQVRSFLHRHPLRLPQEAQP